jgi:MtaA/CmuA family methyltransferase
MTYKERLLKTLDGEKVDRPPLAVPTQNITVGAMKEAGVFWPEALQKAEPMAKLAMDCQKSYGFESIRLPFDINVEAETMGCETRYGEESDPPMSTPKNRDELDQLIFPEPVNSGRMAEVIKAVKIVSNLKDTGTPLIVALGTPFEVLCTIYNFDEMYGDLKDDPGALLDLLEKILEVQVKYAKELVDAGAEVMMIVDGTSQTLMPEHFVKFSSSFTKRLIDTIDRPTILHICGNPSRLIKDMAATGADALSIDSSVAVDKAKAEIDGKCVLVGNLDVSKLYMGSPEEVVEMVDAARDAGIDIIAPGCGIMPDTPIENLHAYVKAVISS